MTILLIISWLVVGFISMVFTWLCDMRGAEFNKNYFDKDCIMLSFFILIWGYASLIILCCILISKHINFTKLIYKIANIGVKKTEESRKNQ